MTGLGGGGGQAFFMCLLIFRNVITISLLLCPLLALLIPKWISQVEKWNKKNEGKYCSENEKNITIAKNEEKNLSILKMFENFLALLVENTENQ